MANLQPFGEPLPTSTAELLRIALGDPDINRSRAASANLIERRCEQHHLEIILQAARHPDPETRRRAIRISTQLPFDPAHGMSLIASCANDPIWTVREAALLALGKYQSDGRASAVLMERALHDKSRFVREAAVRCLAQSDVHRDSAIEGLLNGLAHQKPPVRCRAARALASFREAAPRIMPAFVSCLEDSHARVRKAVLEALCLFEDAAVSALPAIIRRRFDGDWSVQLAANEALRTLWRAAPTTIQPTLRALVERKIGIREVGQRTFASSDLSEVRQTFLQICHRRLKWWTRITKEQPAAQADPSLFKAVEDVIQAAVVARGPAYEEKEFAWLLAKLIEVQLGLEQT